MADTPGYKMNTGDPEQLPKGAAKELNDAAPAPQAPQPGGDPATGQEVPARQVITRQPDTNPVLPGNEDDDILFGPTMRPDEHIITGAGFAEKATMPPNMSRWVPALVEAARDPEAPAMFKEMLQLIQYHMGR